VTPNVFRESRKLIGLSQTALADRLGLSLRQVRNLETGVSPIKGVHEFALRWIALQECNLNLPFEYQDDAFHD
jgi:transcriptional regulator with XRE-family HTH domain